MLLTDRNRCRFHKGHRVLTNTKHLKGFLISATDGEMGHLDGFIVDDRAWAIEVATRNWWPGKKVLVSPAWIEGVSWSDSKDYGMPPYWMLESEADRRSAFSARGV